jgi:hypothetical protein
VYERFPTTKEATPPHAPFLIIGRRRYIQGDEEELTESESEEEVSTM